MSWSAHCPLLSCLCLTRLVLTKLGCLFYHLPLQFGHQKRTCIVSHSPRAHWVPTDWLCTTAQTWSSWLTEVRPSPSSCRSIWRHHFSWLTHPRYPKFNLDWGHSSIAFSKALSRQRVASQTWMQALAILSFTGWVSFRTEWWSLCMSGGDWCSFYRCRFCRSSGIAVAWLWSILLSSSFPCGS